MKRKEKQLKKKGIGGSKKEGKRKQSWLKENADDAGPLIVDDDTIIVSCIECHFGVITKGCFF